MSITKTFASKLVVAFVAVAMLFSLSFASVNAQSESELQAQIDSLLATIAALQAQLGGGSTPAGTCSGVTFTRDLSLGSTGADVKALQELLNADAETRVAASGVGSAGQETTYYGALTAAAVSKFQTKYRSEVLDPLGIVNPTGYFGASSRAKANAICAQGVDDDDDATDDDDDVTLGGGEASLENFNARDGDDTNILEGQDDAPVMDVEFDVEDGDARVERIDVAVDAGTNGSGKGSNGEGDPWDTFETVSIWVDGDKIAEVDADSKGDWEEDTPNSGDFRIRLSGLDWVVEEGETAEFTVGVTVQGGVDVASGGDTWIMFIPDNGIRARDGEGVDQNTGQTSDTVSFDIDEEGDNDELAMKSSSDDPDATTLQLESDETSDFHTIFAFRLDTEDSENDIEIEELPISVEVSSGTLSLFQNDVRLVVDGETYDDFSFSDGDNDGANEVLDFDFDSGEFVIEAGEEVTVELQVEFKALSEPGNEGVTIEATSSAANITAEGSDDLESNQLSGSANGEEHTMRTEGIILSVVSTSETTSDLNEAGSEEKGTFTVEFEVTAFETDVFISKVAASGTATTNGVGFIVEDSSGDQVIDSTNTAALSSTADTEGTRFKVDEGDTETFTLIVDFNPTTTGFFRVQLDDVSFNDTNDAGDTTQSALPPEDFETDLISIESATA